MRHALHCSRWSRNALLSTFCSGWQQANSLLCSLSLSLSLYVCLSLSPSARTQRNLQPAAAVGQSLARWVYKTALIKRWDGLYCCPLGCCNIPPPSSSDIRDRPRLPQELCWYSIPLKEGQNNSKVSLPCQPEFIFLASTFVQSLSEASWT